ncbi:ABC-three component system protein [Pseudovibrio sp. SCP19]|uniref:ABC-three component system protein n=1 Tax=Pseudovibrio sp. SCP19 TaxID=3141374 RepID=UPI00333D29E7
MAKKKSNGQISIEKFDDVFFEDGDLAECMMQAKHHIVPKPLADKSVEVWKTIRVWAESWKSRGLSNTSTALFLITTGVAEEGTAMALLRSGSTERDRQKARELLCDAAKTSTNKETSHGRTAFLALSPIEMDSLLARVEVFDKHPNLVDMMDEVEGELRIVAPTNANLASQYLEGWWLGQVAPRLVSEGNATIPVQNIIIKASEIGKMFGPETLPVDDPERLGVKSYTEDDERTIFVKQMREVGAPSSTIERGVKDFYRASAQRSRWARENLLLDGEVSQYNEKIQDLWARKRDEEFSLSDLKSEESKKLAGRKLLFWATQQSIAFRNIVETWITSGSYHGLADRVTVGWHPDFEARFSEVGDGDCS